ncbi:MAG: hypothetical protein WAZ94_15320 [Phycisphaerales bacterium]
MNWMPDDAWWSLTPPITGGSTNRSSQLLEQILDQFDVETSKRYRRAPEGTKCNIFVWDATRALACEVPQRELTSRGLVQQNANAMCDWLLGNMGRQHAWNEVAEHVARSRADSGFPVVVTQKNPGGIGHIAMGTRAPEGAEPGKLWIAQAGGKNFRRGRVLEGFLATIPVRFFTHN